MTTTSLIKKLRKELDGLLARIAKLEEQANGMRATIAYLTEKDGQSLVSPARTLSSKTPQKPGEPAQSDTSMLMSVMKEILEANGRPMHRRAILEALSARGISMGGQSPINNVSAHLSLGKHIFKSVGGGYWALLAWGNHVQPVTGHESAD